MKALFVLVLALSCDASPVAHAPTNLHINPYLSRESEASYEFGYEVNDEKTGTKFGANEGREGVRTAGEYHVNLPDGRRQVVNYRVSDQDSGFVADVRYEHGQAITPSYHKPLYQQQPSILDFKARQLPKTSEAVRIAEVSRYAPVQAPKQYVPTSTLKPVHQEDAPAPFLLELHGENLPEKIAPVSRRPQLNFYPQCRDFDFGSQNTEVEEGDLVEGGMSVLPSLLLDLPPNGEVDRELYKPSPLRPVRSHLRHRLPKAKKVGGVPDTIFRKDTDDVAP